MSIATMNEPLANKRKRQGTGIEYLRDELASDSMSASAKLILQELLHEHKVPVEQYSSPASSSVERNHKKKIRKPIDTNMSDERILQLAQEGELSFLASLLKIIQDEGGNVTTKFLIKACCLSVEPGKVPAYCDAKEMVMSALHFMSQSFHGDQESFPTLPLIEPVSKSTDIEKRAYCKVGDWQFDDIIHQVLRLEEIFYESCDSYKWIAREHCVPKLTSGRNLLLLKGSPPSFCVPKTRKPSLAAPRRKAPPKVTTTSEADLPAESPEKIEPTSSILDRLPSDQPVDEMITSELPPTNDVSGASDAPSSHHEATESVRLEVRSTEASASLTEQERSYKDAEDGSEDDEEIESFLLPAK